MILTTADTANSSSSAFTGLFTQAAEASRTYLVEAVIFFKAAATTTGLVTALDAPSSAYTVYGMEAGESVTAWRTLVTNTPGTALVGTASGAATILMAHLYGTVVVGATPGNIVVKFRSEVNGSAVTVLRGSYAKFTVLS